MNRWVLAALGAMLAACGPAPGHAAQGNAFAACSLPGVDGPARCGRIAVPESRRLEGGREIELKVVVLPATGEPARRAHDAITFLAGGGVMPATHYAPFLARVLQPLRASRDIVLVDQRGSGESNPLHCTLPSPIFDRATYADRTRYVAAVQSCVQNLSSRADLRAYNTVEAMHDLDAVRSALGYAQWSIWGVSYGTKAARVYLRQYPERVRVAVLYGVVPLAFSMWTDIQASERRMLQAILDRCQADAGCRSRHPRVETELAQVLERLAASPHRFAAPAEDATLEGVIDHRAFLQLLLARLSSTRESATIPALISRAHAGDLSGLTTGLDARPPPIPAGVYHSIACSEERALWQAGDVTVDGEWLAHERDACSVWLRAAHPDAFWTEVASDIPLLLVSGEDDHLTPPSYAERIAATLSGSKLVRIPNAGHGDINPCIGGLFVQALEAGGVADLDTGCIAALPAYAFAED